ncbi:BXL6, partial [Symbiodinium pilosum]
AGLFSMGERRKTASWLSLRIPDLCWASLEQRGGRPVESAEIPLSQVLHVRNTGLMLELAIKDQPALQLEFGAAEERVAWEKYVNLALEVLVPESERAERDAAKATHRAQELEERRALNEERKKRLSDGLGMRFTAEAMVTRST